MQVQVRYFYVEGQEMKQHDLVYLKGLDRNQGLKFKGICKIASCDGELLRAYFLGQETFNDFNIEIYVEDIEELTKLDGREIDEAVKEVIERL